MRDFAVFQEFELVSDFAVAISCVAPALAGQ
jgi:hypothetical protein